ncbi:AAA family ATPase [Paenibacillus taiwanensis]|uniref:AAA family ATPase n=1 Tax=Paenibacillus taiwanensis TaxID=401638 RepID=UPI000402B4A3|nr:AAA family ATPase [Paenibacillus taiwanensis]
MTSDNRSITTQDRKISIVFNNYSESIQPPEPKESMTTSIAEEFPEAFNELDEMIGLDEVKQIVFEIYAMLRVQKIRQAEGLQANSQVYHMIFSGNPGTGKTTVARIVAKMFHQLGVISKGHLLEVDRADLVGEYIGHTAQKTREVVKKAMGGVLFVDEAYSLARGGEKDFGKEAIDCLVKLMEDRRNDFILIIAGYPREMNDLLELNTGLPSRFAMHVDFPDYSIDELIKILLKMAFEKEYVIQPSAIDKIKEYIVKEKEIKQNFSNARFIRNMLEKAIRNHAVRLTRKWSSSKINKSNLINLTNEDFHYFEKNEPAPSQSVDPFDRYIHLLTKE